MALMIRRSLRQISSSISSISYILLFSVYLFTSSTLHQLNKIITLTSFILGNRENWFRTVTTKFGTGGQETLLTNIAFSTGMAPCVVSLPNSRQNCSVWFKKLTSSGFSLPITACSYTSMARYLLSTSMPPIV